MRSLSNHLIASKRLDRSTYACEVGGQRFEVADTPPNHQPANLIGVRLIMSLGMSIDDKQGLTFSRPLPFW
jgi:hypothetical protein